MESIVSSNCKCVSISRVKFDFVRKCWNYTCCLQPQNGESDDIFASCDLFANDFKVPVRDLAIRVKHPEIAAKSLCSGDEKSPILPADDVLAEWDKIVSAEFVGKTTIVDSVTISVAELSDGRISSYDVEVGNQSIEVASRKICALHGRLNEAIARVKNQIARYISKKEGEES